MPTTKKTLKRFSSSRSSSSKTKKTKFGKRSSLSKKQVLIFVLFFAIIGSALLWWSMAATGAVLNSSNIDSVHSSQICATASSTSCYTIPPPESTGVKRNTRVMQLAAGSVAAPSEVSVFGNNFDAGFYKVCLYAKSLGTAANGQFEVFNYNNGPSSTALATSPYSVSISTTDYKSVACISGVRFDGTSPGMEVSILNQGAAVRVSSAVVYKTGEITPPPNCSVNMTNGQADIDNNPTGTNFCITGTHNWSLHPKTGDTILGDSTAVLDGGNSTQYAIISDANQINVKIADLEIRNYSIKVDAQGAIRNADRSATGWILHNINSHDNGSFDGSNWNGAGADLGIHWTVEGGRYHDNRQEGLAGGDTIGNTTVDGAEIDHNNFTNDAHTTLASSCGHEAGGFKWVGDNITVKNSYIHDNACMGLWDDINSNGAVITNNRVVNNWNSGIFHEVSLGATITYNTVTGNGFKTFNNNPPGCNPGWGGGISDSDSGRTNGGASNGTVDISHNDVEGNCNGITGLDNGASGGSCGSECNVANVHVHDNIIVGSTNPLANNNTGNFEWDNNADVGNSNNTFSNNTLSGGMNFCGNTC